MGLLKEYPYDDGIAVPVELFEDLVYHFNCFYNANTPQAQAYQLLQLAEQFSMLKTWHPNYDVDSGEIARPVGEEFD